MLDNIYWNFKFLVNSTKNSSKLRIILGVGRSGTTWISNSLAKTKDRIRFYEEPLFHFKPKVNLSDSTDHTAIKYKPSFFAKKRLINSYLALTSNTSNYVPGQFIKRFDNNYDFILVKEVHSLLGIEYLACSLKCPIIFVKRNAIYIVDSLVKAQGFNTIYLNQEYHYCKEKDFQLKFFPKQIELNLKTFYNIERLQDKRKKSVYKKIFTIYNIYTMISMLTESYNNLKVISYESICLNPEKKYNEMAQFFNFRLEEKAYNFGKSLNVKNTPYSLNRNLKDQRDKKIEIITDYIPGITSFFKEISI